jgi:hypothetical protein
MAIGQGWAEGAWVDASWVVGAWAQAGTTKTIGGTSQLEAFSSSGTIDVVVPKTIGASSQLEAFNSSGGITVAVDKTIGGTSQLGPFTSSGFLDSGEDTTGGQRGPITVGKKKRKTLKTQYTKKEEYYLSKEFLEKIQKGTIEVAGVEVVLQDKIEVPQLTLPEPTLDISSLKDEVEREIAELLAIKLQAKELADYEEKVKLYVEEMQQMEMKMYFIALALLDEDF